MLLVNYWWQGILLLLLYFFLYLVYKEINKADYLESEIVLKIIQRTENNENLENQTLSIQTKLPLEMQGDKIFIEKERFYIKANGYPKKEINIGENFQFAGRSLQLVRWKNAR